MDVKLLVAVPNNTGFCSEYCRNSFFLMGWELRDMGIPALSMTLDNYPLSTARNLAVKELLENVNHFTHLLFVDADTPVPQGGIRRLLSHDLPIVSSYQLSRKGTGLLVVMKQLDPMPKQFPPSVFPSFKGLHPKEFEALPRARNGLVEVDGVGCGCILLRRDVFEKLDEPYFKEDWGESTDAFSYGEDLYFCLNARYHGIKIYVDSNVFCPHLAWQFLDQRHYQMMLGR